MTIDLTEPLEDRLGDFMRQLGEALPANAEIRVGPQRFEEETVRIGGKRYETIRATREITFAQRGWEQTGSLSTWRCIDVPLDGIVKAASDLPGVMRQNMVLLDHGHGKASRRKPRAASKAAATALMGPGHWRIQTSMLGVESGWDLLLRASGQLQHPDARAWRSCRDVESTAAATRSRYWLMAIPMACQPRELIRYA
jgi:hypothetical protein